jgi:hypothetical protein
MTTAAIAALAALAGVALGRFLDSWTETRRWLRERRSDAYGAFLGAAERYLSGALVVYGKEDYKASPQGMELDRVYGDLQLFGSEAAYNAAQQVRNVFNEFHALRLSADNTSQDHAYTEIALAVTERYRAEMDRFRRIAKGELRVR